MRTTRRPVLPSNRDFHIFCAVKCLGMGQSEVANKMQISQGRVSKIVSGVNRFLDAYGPGRWAPPQHRVVLAKLIHQLVKTKKIDELAHGEFTVEVVESSACVPAA